MHPKLWRLRVERKVHAGRASRVWIGVVRRVKLICANAQSGRPTAPTRSRTLPAMDVLYATCAHLPEPDPDQAPTVAALEALGLSVAVRGWDDPDARWDDGRLVLPRATWTYPWAVDAFRRWLGVVSATTPILNPPDVLRWNLHKGYLLALADAGVPVTPTALLRAGDSTSFDALLAERGWDEVVVKPAISGGSFRTLKVTGANRDEGRAHLADLVSERDVLVQPYLRSVEGHGERSLIWVDGVLTHAIRKNPRFQGMDESVSTTSVPIAPAEAAVADAAIAAARSLVPADELLYARVDVAPDAAGRYVLMELELIEPSLFFPQGPKGAARFAAAVARYLG